MSRLTLREAIDPIYAAAADPRGWVDALEKVASYVGGSGAMIVHNDIARNSGGIITGGLREDLGALYVREHCRNPLVLAIARAVPLGTPVLAGTLIERRHICKTAFHADILDPQRIVDQIVVPHHALSRSGASGGFAVTLTERHIDDAAACTRRMGLVAPHMARAFELSLELSRLHDGARQFGLLLDMLPSAALLLDHRLRIIRANVGAEALLSAADGIAAAPGHILTAAVRDQAYPLRAALTAALDVGDASDFQQSLRLWRLSDLPPLLVIITPLPPPLFALQASIDAQARLLVQVIDPVSRLDDRTALLQQAYGLTSAEARVAGLIGSGLTAPQAGQALGLSPTTIRTHLAHCFDKTGTHSQDAIARLVSAILTR